MSFLLKGNSTVMQDASVRSNNDDLRGFVYHADIKVNRGQR